MNTCSFFPQAKTHSLEQIPKSLQAVIAKSLFSADWLSDQINSNSMADWLVHFVYGHMLFELKDFSLELGPGESYALLQPVLDALIIAINAVGVHGKP